MREPSPSFERGWDPGARGRTISVPVARRDFLWLPQKARGQLGLEWPRRMHLATFSSAQYRYISSGYDTGLSSVRKLQDASIAVDYNFSSSDYFSRNKLAIYSFLFLNFSALNSIFLLT